MIGKREPVGNKIKELRLEKKLTQLDLAKELHVDASTIAKYETGKVTPSLSMIYILIDYFKVSANYLLGLED